MVYFIHWAGFIGAWLLVAGPLVQAALELRDENLDREAFEELSAVVPRPAPVSRWWWLLPPVAFVMSRRRSSAYENAVLRAMTVQQRTLVVGFSNKATGWFFVAGGAFLIFLKESWELVELYELPDWVFWVVAVLLAILAVGNTVARLGRSEEMIHLDDPHYAAAKEARRAAARMRRSR